MFGYFLLLIILIINANVIANKYSISITFALPIVFNAIAIAGYLLGLFDVLWIVIFLCIFVTLYSIVITIKNGWWKSNERGLYILYFIDAVFFVVLSYGRNVWAGDDLYHWGLVIKNMYYWNRYCIESPVTINFTNYSEYTAIIPYIVVKLNFKWNDYISFASQSLWGMTLLLPIMFQCRLRRNIYSLLNYIIRIFILIFLPGFYGFRYMTYNCLQADRLLGFAAAFSIVIVFVEFGDKKIINSAFLISLISLCAIKETGIYIAMMILVVYITKGWINNEIIECKYVLIIVSNCIITFLTWNIYCKVHNATVYVNRSAHHLSASFLKNIFEGKEVERHNVLMDAIRRALSIDFFQIGWNRCYLLWMIVAVCLCCFIALKEKRGRIKAIIYSFYIIIFSTIWWIGVMYVELFKSSIDEMVALTSYDRYLDTIFISFIFALLIVFFTRADETRMSKGAVIVFGITIILFSYSNIKYNFSFCFANKVQTQIQMDNVIEKADREVLNRMTKENDKIYIISQQNIPMVIDYYLANYYLAPIQCNLALSENIPDSFKKSYFLTSDYEMAKEDEYVTYYSEEEFWDVLYEYTYVLILYHDDNFDNSYYNMFQNNKVEEGFYKIDFKGKELIKM